MISASPPQAPAASRPESSPAERWLVVDQQPSPPIQLDALLQRLQSDFGLDPYTARQRIIGRGYVLFARGPDDRLAPLAVLLRRFGVVAAVITPARPAVMPRKLQSLAVTSEALTLTTEGGGRVTITPEATVAAVLADLSGAVVERSIKRLLVRNAYQGSPTGGHLSEEAICREIVKGKPVLDLYLLEGSTVREVVRAFPARFDASGLGDRMSPSAAMNLLALLDLVRQQAGHCVLRTDFGLANLPGCQLPGDADANQDGNALAALTRFGWIAATIAATAEQEPPASAPLEAVLNTAVAAGSPAAAVVATMAALAEDTGVPARGAASAVPPEPTLPPPPDVPEETGFRLRENWSDLAGIVVGLILFLFHLKLRQGGALPVFWHYAFGLGILPALFGGFCFWRGYYYLSLKRTVENTPVSRIRSLASGMVEVSGRAVRRYALVAPMTQLPCVYYRLRRYRRDQRNRWQQVGQQSSGAVPFAVEDATGRVLVDPRQSDLRPGIREEGRGSGGGPLGTWLSADADEKWVEEVIPEGATLYILGFAHLRKERRASLAERTAVKLRDLKGSGELLARFDRDGDGRISADEWEAARQTMEMEASHEQLGVEERRVRQEELLVIATPPRRGLPFVIAQSLDEPALIRAFAWRSILFLAAAALFIGWTLRQLVVYLA